MNLQIRQGEGGRWRWFLRDGNDVFRADSRPQGFATRDEALKDAQEVFGSALTLYDPDEGELYAGPRDFQ